MSWSEHTPHPLREDDSRKRTRLLDEVRARIMWGEAAEDVKLWALAQDVVVTEQQIDEASATAQRERSAGIRRRGRRDLLWGLPLLVPGAAIVLWALVELYVGVWLAIVVDRANPVVAYVLLVLGVALCVAGGFLTGRGLDRLIFGPRAASPHP
jgi:hypothetical protein